MANTVFKLRRSSVAGKQPNTSTLAIGELALNLTDRKLYSSDGTNVWETGANLTTLTVSTNTSVNNVIISGGIYANGSFGSAGQVLTSNSSGLYWATSTGGGGALPFYGQYTGDGVTTSFSVTGGYTPNYISVYLNGVLLRNGSEVTVTSGTDVVITPAPPNGSLIDVVGVSSIYSTGVNQLVSTQFTANGTANSFAVTGGYVANQVLVFLNGVKQIPGTDVDITSGSNVAFYSTPANGFIVDVYGNQTTVGLSSSLLTVGANVIISSNSISVGNSSVNTQIVAGNVFLNGSTLVIGNTAANVTINSTAVSVSGQSINSTNYQTTSGLSANVATLTSNNTSFVGSVSAANVVSNAQLSSNLSNYALLSGSTFTGNVTINGIKSGYAPNRPAFRVYGSGTTNNLTTTQNTTGALNANNWTADFNQGSYLSGSTGVFTAPVAGLYQVNIVGRNSGYASGISQLGVTKNGTSGGVVGGTCIMMIEFAASSSMNHAGASTIIYLAVNDTLALKVLAGQINFDGNDNWSVAYIG